MIDLDVLCDALVMVICFSGCMMAISIIGWLVEDMLPKLLLRLLDKMEGEKYERCAKRNTCRSNYKG